MSSQDENLQTVVTEKWRSGNIVLTGASGSGKSTIGRQLAKLIGLGFIDLDDMIEKDAGKKISAIFESDGESGFRERERRMLETLHAIRSHVIAVGGGALLSEDAVAAARSIGPLVWVQSSPVEVARRLFRRVDELATRPLFKDLLGIEDNDKRRQMIRSGCGN